MRLEHERNRPLFEQGLASQEILRKSEAAEGQAGIELRCLEAARKNAYAATRADLDSLALETGELQQDQAEARRVLGLATPRDDCAGVVTWTPTEEGATIRKGDVIARLADLSAFRVDASVSNACASRLGVGQPVQVRVDDRTLDGQISDVLPMVRNGVITIRVALKDRSNPAPRQNLRVDVFIVIGLLDEPTKGREQLNGTLVSSYRYARWQRCATARSGSSSGPST